MDVLAAPVWRYNFRVILAQYLCAFDLRDSSCAVLCTQPLGIQSDAEGAEPIE